MKKVDIKVNDDGTVTTSIEGEDLDELLAMADAATAIGARWNVEFIDDDEDDR